MPERQPGQHLGPGWRFAVHAGVFLSYGHR